MKSLVILSLLAFALAGCVDTRNDRVMQGAGIGAVGGAVIGGVASRSVGGAVVGGVAGAVIGGVVADATGRHKADRRCYRDRYDRTICRHR